MIEITTSTVPLPDGRSCAVFRIEAAGGIAVTVAELGATLLRIDAPDRRGRLANVLLGSDDISRYPAAGAAGADACLGATCGRVANRTAGARFTLDGCEHRLDENEPPNHLHGGRQGFGRRLWLGMATVDGVRLTLVSPDGDQGYPGTLEVTAEISVTADEVAIVYTARVDRPTHVNIVSHPYFNLAGDPAAGIVRHELAIAADAFLPIGPLALPEAPCGVAGTPFDFREARAIGDGIDADDPQIRVADGYNHCFVLRAPEAEGALRPAAWLRSPESGRTMTLLTDQPGLQFYTANALKPSANADAALRFGRRSGLCLEAQGFPNAANRPDFPSTRLDPGQEYRSELRLRFGVED